MAVNKVKTGIVLSQGFIELMEEFIKDRPEFNKSCLLEYCAKEFIRRENKAAKKAQG